MPALTLSSRRIAIFEDNPTNRDRLAEMVTRCGGVALPVAGPAPKLTQLKNFYTSQNVQLVICDHHLSQQSDYATYYGAQAVAESYRHGIGGILVTAYEGDDAELSLRLYRRKIPALIRSPGDLDRANLQTALLQAENEVQQHQLTRERVPHRTIMTVLRVDQRGTSKIVKVMMSQWNSTQEVGFPLDLIPMKLRIAAKPGNLLIAQVNIDAARSEDLFFDEFELPDPHALKKTKSILGRP
jgi:CheY-like chemotaxis protein